MLQQIVNGLTLGSTYALLALGYSMIFGVLQFINFAHGAVAMVGAYVAWDLVTSAGLSFWPACLIGIAASALLGVIIERIAYKPLRRAPKLSMIIASLGFSFIITTSVQLIWGTQSQSMPAMIANNTIYNIGSVTFNTTQLIVTVIGFVVMALLALLVNKTKLGTSIRAVSQDRDTAELMCINVNKTVSMTFLIGSALAAMSAIMMTSYYSTIYPSMGDLIGTKGFAAVVLGGAGSIPGAMIGGLAIGVIECLAGAIFSAQVREAAAFIVLIAVLLVKPSGILGKEVVKE